MALVPLYVILFSTTAALTAEFLQWFLVFRTPGFQALKANLVKHGKKVDEAKEGTGGAKSLKKKEQRLQTWKEEAGRQMASYNWKASVVMMFCMFGTYKLMMRLFSDVGPVGRLPFEPPPFLQKLTLRGLEGADSRDCSALFIFLLCQSSVRMVISKVLNLGMGREFQDIMPTMPKGFPGMGDDSKKAR